jgi:TetR/AcrR family transcriptional regulator, mexJK operon transcriptional repressor
MMNFQTSTNEFTIGQLADAVTKISGLRCTPAMIYNYEKQGLLPPPRRSPGGMRKFSREDVARVVQIKRAQAEGFSLDEIKNGLETEFLPKNDLLPVEIPNDRKTAILNAAAVIFPQKGYLETTLNDIAREAGVAVTTVYQHFGSKEQLFLALTDSFSFVQSLENIETALKLGEGGTLQDLRQAMIGVANAFLYAPVANVEIIRLFITEVKRFPEIGKVYREHLVPQSQGPLAEFFNKQITRGVFRPVDVRLAADAFLGMFLTTVINEYMFLDRDLQQMPTPEGVAAMVDIFLRGMLVKAPA